MKRDPVVATKNVLQTKLFTVEEVQLQLANKQIQTHHVVKRKPTVSVFPITDNNEIFLVSQYRYMLKSQTLESMAGFIDPGEEALSAAKRELREETGITASIWEDLGTIALAGSVIAANNHLFVARDLTFGEQDLQDEEDIEVVKLSLEKAVEKVITGEISHAASVIGILLLERKLKHI